jgi:hypothetical protein
MIDRGRDPGGQAEHLAEESEALFAEAAAATTEPERTRAFLEGLKKVGDAELAAAYTFLQKAIGVIAVLLPPVLLVGHAAFRGWDLLGSVSSYYYSHLGNVFVGALCALAVFFLSYNHWPLPGFNYDQLLARCAALAAVGVAVFPTLDSPVDPSGGERLVSAIHLTSAGILFVLLGVFARFRFVLSKGDPTPQKARRNRVYKACGTIIFVAIALIAVNVVVETPSSWHAFLWLEIVCIEAFGVSWLVKGGFLGILADPPTP